MDSHQLWMPWKVAPVRWDLLSPWQPGIFAVMYWSYLDNVSHSYAGMASSTAARSWQTCLPTTSHTNHTTVTEMMKLIVIAIRNPKVIWEEPHHHPSLQRMGSTTVCYTCTMPTADESNHSAARMPYPHRSATFSLSTLHCPISPYPHNICPFLLWDMEGVQEE